MRIKSKSPTLQFSMKSQSTLRIMRHFWSAMMIQFKVFNFCTTSHAQYFSNGLNHTLEIWSIKTGLSVGLRDFKWHLHEIWMSNHLRWIKYFNDTSSSYRWTIFSSRIMIAGLMWSKPWNTKTNRLEFDSCFLFRRNLMVNCNNTSWKFNVL